MCLMHLPRGLKHVEDVRQVSELSNIQGAKVGRFSERTATNPAVTDRKI